MPEISIIVCTRDRPESLKRCVNSILSNNYDSMELLIVDQSEDSKSRLFVESLNDPRVIVKKIETRGLACARNLALRLSKGKIITFTDDDCVVAKDWIKNVLYEFSTRPDIAAVYGRVLPYGKIKEDMFCHAINESEELEIIEAPILPHTLGHGNNMSFRKEIFEEIGNFEEMLGAGTKFYAGEDTDFTLRLMERGFKLCYSPRPLVYHDKWHSLEESRGLDYKYLLGATIVFGKHLILKRNKVALVWLFKRPWEIGSHLKLVIRDRDFSRLKYVKKMYCYYCYGTVTSIYLILTEKLYK